MKVKSHCNIWFNEVADRLAKEGAEIDKCLYNIWIYHNIKKIKTTVINCDFTSQYNYLI